MTGQRTGEERSGRTTLDYSANDPQMIKDSCPFFREARARTPVFYSPADGGFWTVSRYDDVWEVIHDPERFTSSIPGATVPVQTLARGEGQGFIPLEFDDPLHAAYRAVIAPLFTPRRIRSLEPKVRAGATKILTRLAADGRDRQPIDLVADLIVPFVTHALAVAIGLRGEEVVDIVEVMDAILHSRSSPEAEAGDASQRLRAVVRSLIDQRRRHPQDPSEDFFTRLHGGVVEGRPLTDEEMESYGVDILLAGYESTINGIGVSLSMIGGSPEIRRSCLQHLSDLARPVEELLRLVAPVQLFGRNATCDLELRGQPITEGDMVVMHFASANRDNDIFEEPDTFVADRWPNRHLSFGAGAHFCLGAHLARQEMRICLEEVLSAHPELRIIDTEQCRPQMGAHGDLRGYSYLPAILTPGPSLDPTESSQP